MSRAVLRQSSMLAVLLFRSFHLPVAFRSSSSAMSWAKSRKVVCVSGVIVRGSGSMAQSVPQKLPSVRKIGTEI